MAWRRTQEKTWQSVPFQAQVHSWTFQVEFCCRAILSPVAIHLLEAVEDKVVQLWTKRRETAVLASGMYPVRQQNDVAAVFRINPN